MRIRFDACAGVIALAVAALCPLVWFRARSCGADPWPVTAVTAGLAVFTACCAWRSGP